MKRNLLTTALSLLSLMPVYAQTADNGETETDRIEWCKQNYQRLFQGEALTGKGNDPELMDILQKFIFGEVFQSGDLSIKMREMITCVCLATMQTLPQLEAHANAALNVGVTPLELREAIYQCAPFVGFPKTLNAIETINKVFRQRGYSLPLETQGTVTEENRHAEGANIQTPLYGTEIKDAMRVLPEGMRDDVPNFLTEMCFGDFYTRGTLDVRTRELLVLCGLATLGADRQLVSHTAGCLKAGNTKETLYASMIQCLPYIGFPYALNAIHTIKAVAEKSPQPVHEEQTEMIFPAQDRASNEYNTGEVYVSMLKKEGNAMIAHFRFMPGSRNFWHYHPDAAQTLMVLDGEGYYQEKGKPKQLLRKGDVIVTPANVEHWNGATPGHSIVCMTVTEHVFQDHAVQLRAVTDEEYRQ